MIGRLAMKIAPCHSLGMMRTHRVRRSYDHRLSDAIAVTGNADLFRDVSIPASTRRTWARGEVRPVVAAFDVELEVYELLEQVDDQPSCPKSFPSQLTRDEVSAMRDFVESESYRHIAVQNLALYAQRLGKLFASASTWYKLIRERGWKRPRRRVHPAKPKEGLRATRPNEFWQIDTTVIRLTTGIRIYLQAVIDNFSRRILAWRVSDMLSSATTRELLIEASKGLPDESANANVVVVTDGGSENFGEVEQLLEDSNSLSRVLAQTDIVCSNSLIEAFWRQLKHAWLFP